MQSIVLKKGRNIIRVDGPVRISTRKCQSPIRMTGGDPADMAYRDGTGDVLGMLGPRLNQVFNFGLPEIAIVGREGDVVEYATGSDARAASRTW